ncbi:MAG: helix-turn-helix domain-containing protein [Nitrospira sp. CG24A]|nr:MAG: helix-turn-helix domain-containing protein [Nitrospira sp. CG24A]
MEPVLLRIQETAKLLKVSKWTVYRWIEEGRLHATKIGRGSLRVFRTSVSTLIEASQVNHRSAQSGSRSKVPRLRIVGQNRKK